MMISPVSFGNSRLNLTNLFLALILFGLAGATSLSRGETAPSIKRVTINQLPVGWEERSHAEPVLFNIAKRYSETNYNIHIDVRQTPMEQIHDSLEAFKASFKFVPPIDDPDSPLYGVQIGQISAATQINLNGHRAFRVRIIASPVACKFTEYYNIELRDGLLWALVSVLIDNDLIDDQNGYCTQSRGERWAEEAFEIVRSLRFNVSDGVPSDPPIVPPITVTGPPCPPTETLIHSYMIDRDGTSSTFPVVPIPKWNLAPGSYGLWVYGGIGAVVKIEFKMGVPLVRSHAGISPECTPKPGFFTVPAGTFANRFKIDQLISGVTCETHKVIFERGFSICTDNTGAARAAGSGPEIVPSHLPPPDNNAGYQLYFDGRLVSGPDPGPADRYTRQQAQENCDWNMQTKPHIHIRCVYNGELLRDRPASSANKGYELYFDGKLVSGPDAAGYTLSRHRRIADLISRASRTNKDRL
ncbi:MAG: hypothetical protein HY881_09945 [Deltaproteobacteria bacterium]|nr:hypothetical protein [Deltaproteobacteria bacterium]